MLGAKGYTLLVAPVERMPRRAYQLADRKIAVTPHDERLRLSASEQRGPVGAGKNGRVDGDRTDLSRPASIDSFAGVENLSAKRVVFSVADER